MNPGASDCTAAARRLASAISANQMEHQMFVAERRREAETRSLTGEPASEPSAATQIQRLSSTNRDVAGAGLKR